MGQWHQIRLYAVMAGQNPSRQPLGDFVVAIAGGIVGRLNHEALYVFLQVNAQRTGFLERFLHVVCGNPVTGTWWNFILESLPEETNRSLIK